MNKMNIVKLIDENGVPTQMMRDMEVESSLFLSRIKIITKKYNVDILDVVDEVGRLMGLDHENSLVEVWKTEVKNAI